MSDSPSLTPTGGIRSKLTKLIAILLLAGAAYHSFNIFSTTDFGSRWLPFVVKNLANDHQQATQSVADLQKQLDTLRTSQDVVRFDIAKYIETKEKTTEWSQNITNLIAMYTKLKALSQSSNEKFVLSDFIVDTDQISVKGKVTDMRYVYVTNGIIDRFVGLDFVKEVQIPYYKKAGDYYEFVLQASVDTLKKVRK